jgi:hypothetical protein
MPASTNALSNSLPAGPTIEALPGTFNHDRTRKVEGKFCERLIIALRLSPSYLPSDSYLASAVPTM